MKYLIVFFLSIISIDVTAQACHSLDELDWIYGSWESQDQDRLITESWGRVSDMTLEGFGATYVEGKLQSSESLRIVEMSEALYYIAKVSHNSLPVVFKLNECSDRNAVFENQNHDFPKRIEYLSIGSDKIMVIVGDVKEKNFTISYIRSSLVRVKVDTFQNDEANEANEGLFKH